MSTDNDMDQSDLIRQTIATAAMMEDDMLHHIVLDLSGVLFIDSVGAKVLKQVMWAREACSFEIKF